MTSRFLVCTFAALSVACSAPAVSADRPPNVILFVADDLGYGELGCQGNDQIPTPHIDSIAAGGVRFTQGYVTAPVCCPSRAGLLTGRYQTRFGHELNAIGKQNLDPDIGLPLKETTLTDALKAAGYATGCVGKWHLGGTEQYLPQRRGFDSFYGFLNEGHSFAPPHYPGLISHLRRNEPPYDQDNPILRGEQPIEEEVYLTQAITREANAFITEHAHEPFFLYVPYSAVHSPMQTTPEYFDRFARIDGIHRRVFAAMLSAMDDSVGAILANLRAKQLEEHTLIFFLSDNGGPTAELTSTNLPLRGGKGQLYEGGIRVPFMMQWKGRLPAGRIDDRVVSSLDVFATTAAAAHTNPTRKRGEPSADSPRPQPLDGVNLLPFLTDDNESQPHETLYWRMGAHYALRQGNWKLVRQATPGNRSGVPQLFDLASDASETKDLAGERPELVRELQSIWDRLNSEMVPPRWGPRRNPYSDEPSGKEAGKK